MKPSDLRFIVRECIKEVLGEGRKICAWCKKDMGVFEGDKDSHGICPECLAKMKSEIPKS